MSRGVRWQPKTLTPDFLAPFDFPGPESTTSGTRWQFNGVKMLVNSVQIFFWALLGAPALIQHPAQCLHAA